MSMAVFANVETLSESDQDAPPMQKSKAKAKPKSPAASVKAKSSPSKPNPGPQKATKSKSVLQTGSKMKKPAACVRKRPAVALGGDSDGRVEPGTTAALGEDSDGGVEPGDDSGLAAVLKRPAAAVAGDDGSNPGDEPGDAPDGAPSCSKQPKVSCIYLYKSTGKFAVKRDGKQIFQVGGNHVNSDKAKEIAAIGRKYLMLGKSDHFVRDVVATMQNQLVAGHDLRDPHQNQPPAEITAAAAEQAPERSSATGFEDAEVEVEVPDVSVEDGTKEGGEEEEGAVDEIVEAPADSQVAEDVD